MIQNAWIQLDNPLQYSCLENPQGQRSLAGYSPWGRKESDTTEVTKQHGDDTACLVTAIPEGLHFSVFQLSRTIIICHFPQVLTLVALSWIFSDLFLKKCPSVITLLIKIIDGNNCPTLDHMPMT